MSHGPAAVAKYKMPPCVNLTALTHLAPEHLSSLGRAVSNMMSTDSIKTTFAEIVDGVPARSNYRDYYGKRRRDFEENTHPTTEAIGRVESFAAAFSLGLIELDSRVSTNPCPVHAMP